MIRLISFDPGEKNFAVCVSEHKIDPATLVHQSRVLYSGYMDTIQVLRDADLLAEQARGFYAHIDELFNEFGPFDDIVLERFMGRGVKVGTTSETTNIMIGIIGAIVFARWETPFPTLVNAGVWKQAYAKFSDLSADYMVCCAEVHQFDAALIGHYQAARLMGITPFSVFEEESFLHRFMWWIEKASDTPLVRRRKQRLFHPPEEAWYESD